MAPHKALAAWRAAHGLSQAEAAKRVDVTQAAWSHWEQKAKSPQPEQAAKLEAVTGILATSWPRPKRKKARYHRPHRPTETATPVAGAAA